MSSESLYSLQEESESMQSGVSLFLMDVRGQSSGTDLITALKC